MGSSNPLATVSQLCPHKARCCEDERMEDGGGGAPRDFPGSASTTE